MKASAIRATYSDWKLVKTRHVVQIVFEVPLAEADMAYEVIGGMPNPSSERWFGIAPLISPAAKENLATPQPSAQPRQAGAKRDWQELQPSQQAGIRCAEPTFRAFLREEYTYEPETTDDAAEAVRDLCAVDTRAKLNTIHPARVIWHQLDTKYQAWLAKERVGA